MKKLLYVLRNFQSENYGDLLINDYLISQLSLYCQVDILYYQKNLNLVQEMTCLESANVSLLESYRNFDRGFLLEVITRKTLYDYLCLIPGHSHYQGLKSKIIQIKNTGFLLLLQSFGIECIWLCKSLDNLDFMGRLLEQIVSKFIYKYSVRDSLTNLNNNLKAEVWPDLAFLMLPTQNKNICCDPKIIFSFRGDRGEISQNIVKNSCVSISKQVLSLKNIDEIICLANVSRDIGFMENLSREINENLSLKVRFIDNSNMNKIISLYNKNSLIFTDRLHVALPAMINSAPAFPFIDLSLDQKILGIYKDMGWDNFVISRPSDIKDIPEDFNLCNIVEISMSEVSNSIEESRLRLKSNIAKIFH